MTEDDGSSFLRGTLIIFVGTLVGTGSGFLTRVLAGNYFGKSGYGIIVLGITLLNFLSIIALLGFQQGVVQRVAKSDRDFHPFRTALSICIPFSILISIGIVASAESISVAFGAPRLSSVITIFAAALPLLVFVKLVSSVLRGSNDALGRVLVENIVYQGGVVVFLGGVIVAGLGVEAASTGWVATLTAAVCVGIVYLRRNLDGFEFLHRADSDPPLRERWWSMLTFSAPLLVAQGSWMLTEQVDNIFVGYFGGPRSVGAYDAAFTLGRVFIMIIGVVGYLALPRFAEYYADDAKELFSDLYRRSTKWLVFLSLPLFYIISTAPKLILGTVFRPSYESSWPVLVIIAVGFLTHVSTGMNSQGLVSIEKTKSVLHANLIGLGVNLSLNALLVPPYGILGAGIASAVSFGSLNLYLSWRLKTHYGVTPLSKPLLYPAAASLVLFTGVWSTLWLTSRRPLTLIGAMTVMVAGHAIVVVLFGGIEPADMSVAEQYDHLGIVDKLVRFVSQFVRYG